MAEPILETLGSRASPDFRRSSIAKRVPRLLTRATPMWAEHDYAKRFPTPKRGRKAEGVRYERRVLEALTGEYEGFLSSMPFTYFDRAGRHICIPDGVLLGRGLPVIFEIKLSHTLRAYWELVLLYRPVVSLALGSRVRVCEITRSYDPSSPLPIENSKPYMNVREFLDSGSSEGVVLWRPK